MLRNCSLVNYHNNYGQVQHLSILCASLIGRFHSQWNVARFVHGKLYQSKISTIKFLFSSKWVISIIIVYTCMSNKQFYYLKWYFHCLVLNTLNFASIALEIVYTNKMSILSEFMSMRHYNNLKWPFKLVLNVNYPESIHFV